MKKFDILSAMTSQQIMQDIRVTRVRTLKDEVARLKGELSSVKDELDSLREHFALALLAARDAERTGPNGALLIVDGWNAILSTLRAKSRIDGRLRFAGPVANENTASDEGAADGARGEATKSPEARKGWRTQLAAAVKRWLDKRPADHAWIVFDGPRPGGKTDGRLRISYTGGSGEHRADRFVCDYLRMRRYDGAKGHVIVVTNDKAFRAEAARLGAETSGIEEINGAWALAIEKEKRWIEK